MSCLLLGWQIIAPCLMIECQWLRLDSSSFTVIFSVSMAQIGCEVPHCYLLHLHHHSLYPVGSLCLHPPSSSLVSSHHVSCCQGPHRSIPCWASTSAFLLDVATSPSASWSTAYDQRMEYGPLVAHGGPY